MKKVKKYITMVIIIVVVVVIVIVGLTIAAKPKVNPEVITAASIIEIINISELSTVETRYDGVAVAYNKNNEDKIDYYVAYEAEIQAGFDMEAVEISINEQEKIIIITLPEMTITNKEVKASSMDYIFVNRWAETNTISAEALTLCNADLENESKNQTALIELAKENAINTVTALTEPFLEQVDFEYELVVQ